MCMNQQNIRMQDRGSIETLNNELILWARLKDDRKSAMDARAIKDQTNDMVGSSECYIEHKHNYLAFTSLFAASKHAGE
jgi:hypothetical protein